jgi:hypothetical protein
MAIQFCALCDGNPGVAAAAAGPGPSRSNRSAQASSSAASASASAIASLPSNTTDTNNTTTSAGGAAKDPAESISELLLGGYALLADNCPNPSCRGMPLVGYPRKTDGSRDGRRMCVSCGSRWVDERDMGSMKVVGPAAALTESAPASVSRTHHGRQTGETATTASAPIPTPTFIVEDERDSILREMYGLAAPAMVAQRAKAVAHDTEDDYEGLDADVDVTQVSIVVVDLD